jgi:hypothetical protein
MDHIRLWKDVEPPEAHDTSYVDALCDAHARRLLQSEFANVKPSVPGNIYEKVLIAIEEAEAPKPKVTRPALKPAPKPSTFFQRLYGAISGPATARIVPSGVALLLALSILTPNLSRILSGESVSQQPAFVSATSLAPEPRSTSTAGGLTSQKQYMPEGRSVASTEDLLIDLSIDENRASRGLPPLKQALRLQTPQDRYEYINQRFAPE